MHGGIGLETISEGLGKRYVGALVRGEFPHFAEAGKRLAKAENPVLLEFASSYIRDHSLPSSTLDAVGLLYDMQRAASYPARFRTDQFSDFKLTVSGIPLLTRDHVKHLNLIIELVGGNTIESYGLRLLERESDIAPHVLERALMNGGEVNETVVRQRAALFAAYGALGCASWPTGPLDNLAEMREIAAATQRAASEFDAFVLESTPLKH